MESWPWEMLLSIGEVRYISYIEKQSAKLRDLHPNPVARKLRLDITIISALCLGGSTLSFSPDPLDE